MQQSTLPTIGPEPAAKSPIPQGTGVDMSAIKDLSGHMVKAAPKVEPLSLTPTIGASTPAKDTPSTLSLGDRVASYAERSSETKADTGIPQMSNGLKQGNKKDPLSAMMSAIGEVESSGRYGVTGKVIPSSGDRAYGKYQVMGNNIPSWTEEAIGKSMTPDEFLKNPSAQDAVARFKMNQYYQKFGTIEDVASVWLSGRPLKNNASKDQVTGISTPAYAAKVMNLYKKYSTGQPMAPTLTDGVSSKYGNIAQAMFSATGKTTTPFGGKTRYEGVHPGIDLAAEPGTKIRAFTPGVVVGGEMGKKQGEKGYGNYIIVKDPYGNLHRYSHLQDSWVKIGQPIFTGQDLGSMGNSGSTYSTSGGTGTHLDYRISDAYGKYMNPTKYLNSISGKA